MHRFLTSVLAAVLLGTVAVPAFAADSMSKMDSKSKPAATTKCPAGQTYVKAYTKKDGTKVAATCRKAPASSMKSSSSSASAMKK